MAEAGEPESRRATHGNFEQMAQTADDLTRAFYNDRCTKLNPQQRVAVNQILVKLARISTGDPNHRDHWDDIAGYASLVAKDLP